MAHYRRIKRQVREARQVRDASREFVRKSILAAGTVKLVDDRGMIPGKCCNGGAYGFTTKLTYQPVMGAWKIEHLTTADFNYCDRFAYFQQRCTDCWHWDWDKNDCDAQFEFVSTAKLVEEIVNFVPEVNYRYEW